MSIENLRCGNSHYAEVPGNIAVCPECGMQLVVYASAWDANSGIVLSSGLDVQCYYDEVESPEYGHRHRQSDWQPVVDRIATWCGAIPGR